jgi:hypothetical protein
VHEAAEQLWAVPARSEVPGEGALRRRARDQDEEDSMSRPRRYDSSVMDLGHCTIEWDDQGLPILVIFGLWKEHGQKRVRLKLGLSGAGELARELHRVPKALQEKVDSMRRLLVAG